MMKAILIAAATILQAYLLGSGIPASSSANTSIMTTCATMAAVPPA